MKIKKVFCVLVAFSFVISACQAAFEQPSATPIPLTNTPSSQPTTTPRPTETPKPTRTPKPTFTPNIAATQKYDEFYSLLEQIKKDGYISSTDGKTVELDPFKGEMAQIGWLRFWPVNSVNPIHSDFVFKARFNWSSAATNPESSGCGFVFGIQENGDYYAVYLTNDNISFFLKRGTFVYRVGKTSGTGVYAFENPAEAEFVIAVHDQKAYVLVNGVPTLYTLSVDQTSDGYIGNSVLSGTNSDYGTRCEATEMLLWTMKK